MEYQIIDSDKYNDSGIETLIFPGGELHVKFHQQIQDKGLLFLKLRTWQDVGFASLIIDTISNAKKDKWRAFIPYYPGARQDRRTSLLTPLTVYKTYDLLHSHFLMTWTFDPHSKVLNLLEPRYFMPSDLNLTNFDDVVGIIAPDKGAVDRAKLFLDKYCVNAKFYECLKIRNPDTGELSGYTMPLLLNCSGRYIIIDDICDGGGTFNLLASEFKKQFPIKNKNLSLELFVSHGIFSKGLSNIDPIINHIYTTNSWCQLESNSRLTVLNLSQQQIFDKIMLY